MPDFFTPVLRTAPTKPIDYSEMFKTPLIKECADPNMITVEQSLKNGDERVSNIYQLIINLLNKHAATHQEKAASVNIFDTVRLVELGKAKALKAVAEEVQDMLDSAFRIKTGPIHLLEDDSPRYFDKK